MLCNTTNNVLNMPKSSGLEPRSQNSFSFSNLISCEHIASKRGIFRSTLLSAKRTAVSLNIIATSLSDVHPVKNSEMKLGRLFGYIGHLFITGNAAFHKRIIEQKKKMQP